MNKQELLQQARLLGQSKQLVFDIPQEEKMCLREKDGIWYYEIMERGEISRSRAFATESEACELIFKYMKQSASLPELEDFS